MDPVALLHDGGAEDAGAGSLHDAAERDNCKDQRDKCEVRDVYIARGRFLACLALVPALPVLPGRIVGRIMGPLAVLGAPWVVWVVSDGVVVVGSPAESPGVVCAALCVVGEDGVGGNEQTVALEADVGRQVVGGRAGVGAVGMVQLDEVVEAVLGVGLAGRAAQDLVGRRGAVGVCGIGPAQVGLLVVGVVGVVGVVVGALVCVVLNGMVSVRAAGARA